MKDVNNGKCYLKKPSNKSINSCPACIAGFKNSGTATCGEGGKLSKTYNPTYNNVLEITPPLLMADRVKKQIDFRYAE